MALAKKPFVVIDADILSSSIWSEALHVRMVWFTLLILCDTDGYVGAAIPGIASAAGVTLEQAKDALERLQSPDPYSRTQASEGRRLEVVERGFRIINFMEHLDRLSSERAKARERVRRHRERKRGNVTQPDGNVTVRSENREKRPVNSDQRERAREGRATPSARAAPVPGTPEWEAEAERNRKAILDGLSGIPEKREVEANQDANPKARRPPL